MPPSLRRRPALVALAGLVAGTSACGSSAPEGSATPPETSAAPDTAFPVTVEHTFGETTVPSEPVRVVTVGFDEQDFTLALGVVPVGTREHFGYDCAQRPWAVDLLPEQPLPTVGGQEGIDLEAVAESAEHGTGATPWQEQTLMTGRALGLAERAQEVVDEVEGRFADAAAANPGWSGRSLALDCALDGHCLLGGAGPDGCADDPLFQGLDVVSQDRTVHLGAFDTDLLGALGFASPLSLPYALEAVVPALGAAADRDAATAVLQPAA